MKYEDALAHLKNTRVFPVGSYISPPTPFDPKPTFFPPVHGIQAYMWIIGQAVAGVPQNASPEEVAQYAIDVADALFDKLAKQVALATAETEPKA